MAIDQQEKIDFVSTERATGKVLLTISDHLPWIVDEIDPLYDEGDHLYMLQNKVYRYLDFIESGELYERFPQTKGLPVVINICSLHPLSENGRNLVNNLTRYLGGMGVEVRWELYEPKAASCGAPTPN
ncbi:MAG: DUF6572 domain-containing protein [Roseiarcus sp.]|jgi:hypothetical protein